MMGDSDNSDLPPAPTKANKKKKSDAKKIKVTTNTSRKRERAEGSGDGPSSKKVKVSPTVSPGGITSGEGTREGSTSSGSGLSAYEQERLSNIARNKAFLREQGLDDVHTLLGTSASQTTRPRPRPRPKPTPQVQPEISPPPRRLTRQTAKSDIANASLSNGPAPTAHLDSVPDTVVDRALDQHAIMPGQRTAVSAPPEQHTSLMPTVHSVRNAASAPPEAETSTQTLVTSPASPHASTSDHSSSDLSIPPTPASSFTSPQSISKTWLHSPLSVIVDVALGDKYLRVLSLLCSLESAYNFVNKTRGFSTTNRPAELGKWVRDGRGRGPPPVVTNPVQFGEKWWAWWVSLQPKCRGSSQPLKSVETTQDISCLSIAGANGMLGPVACLCWWGRALNESGAGGWTSWNEAIADITLVLLALIDRTHS